MVLDDDGKWTWDPFIKDYNVYTDKYLALLRDWNRFVSEYNAVV